MKKTMCAILFLLGAVPFAVGYGMNAWMMEHSASVPSFGVIALIFLAAIMGISFFANSFVKSTKHVVVSFNLIAAAVLVLIGIQELILHQYWSNTVGVATQMFYLPLLNLGFQITFWSHTVFPAYFAAFLLMILASYLGCKLQSKVSLMKNAK